MYSAVCCQVAPPSLKSLLAMASYVGVSTTVCTPECGMGRVAYTISLRLGFTETFSRTHS